MERERRTFRTRAARSFVELQRQRRAWVSFAEMADLYRNMTGRSAQDAHGALRASLEFGDFGDRVVHLHPGIGPWRMSRDRWHNIAETQQPLPSTLWNQYLSCCWVRAPMACRWFELQGLEPPAGLNRPIATSPLPARPVEPTPDAPPHPVESEVAGGRYQKATYLGLQSLT